MLNGLYRTKIKLSYAALLNLSWDCWKVRLMNTA